MDAAEGARSEAAVLAELAALPGLGPRTTPWLLAIGITSADELDRRLQPVDGALEVFEALRRSRPGVSLNALWVLEALRLGCNWRQVPEDRKRELRARAAAHDAGAQSAGGRDS